MNTRKVIALLLSMILVFSIPLNSFAYAAESNKNNLTDNIAIKNTLNDINETADYSNAKALKAADGTERYIYLPFSTGGYLIYDKNLDIIHEYSTNTGNEYIEKNTDIYYTGALRYFVKKNDYFVELSTGKSVGSAIKFTEIATTIEERISEKRQKLTSTRLAAARSTISGTVPNYSYNPDGICGSTASAMMLRWYDLYVNQNYVPSNLESSNGVNLIIHLRTYIEGNTSGSTVGQVYSGIASYCSNRGVSHNVGYAVVDINYIVGRIDTYGTPFVLGLYNHPTYNNHWVTCYGYSVSGGYNFAIVNDGWGSTGININLVNCDYMIW